MTVEEFLKEKGILDNVRVIDVNGQAIDYYLMELMEEYASLKVKEAQSEPKECDCAGCRVGSIICENR